MKKSLPYSTFLRMRRICSTEVEFEGQANILNDRFISKGYDKINLDSCLNKVRIIERESLFKKKEPTSRNRIVLSTTFSPSRLRSSL